MQYGCSFSVMNVEDKSLNKITGFKTSDSFVGEGKWTLTDFSTHPGRCRGGRCGGGGGSRREGGPAVGGRGGGAGGRGVAGARFGASTPGAEGSQTLRRSFRKDEFLPQLQVGATASCRETERGKTTESGRSYSFSPAGGGRGSEQGEGESRCFRWLQSVHVSFESAREQSECLDGWGLRGSGRCELFLRGEVSECVWFEQKCRK